MHRKRPAKRLFSLPKHLCTKNAFRKVSPANGSAKDMEFTEGGGQNAALRSVRLHRATFRDRPIGRTAPMEKAGGSDWATFVRFDPCWFCLVQLGPVRFRLVSSASFQNDPVRSGPVRSRSVGSYPLPENLSNFGRCDYVWLDPLKHALIRAHPTRFDLLGPGKNRSGPVRSRPTSFGTIRSHPNPSGLINSEYAE